MVSQGCTAWHSTAVSLSAAKNSGKVKYNHNRVTYIYDQIIEKDSIYYGQKSGMDIRMSDQNAFVFLKNYKKSKTSTIILIGIGIPILGLTALSIAVAVSFSN